MWSAAIRAISSDRVEALLVEIRRTNFETDLKFTFLESRFVVCPV